MATQRNKPSSPPAWWANRLLGLAVGLVCSAWVFFLHIYLPPPTPFIPWLMAGLAFALLLWRAALNADHSILDFLSQPPWLPYAGLFACGAALAVFPYPYNLGAAFLVLTWAILSFASAKKQARTPVLLRSGLTALGQTGLLLAATAALLPFVFAWAARVHQFEGPGQLFAYPVGWLLKLFGQPVEFIPGGALFLRTFEDTWPFTITAEKLLPVPLILFALVWSGIILIRRRQVLESLGWFWLGLLGFVVLRTAVLILALIQRNNPSFFWNPWIMTLSVVAFGLLVEEKIHHKDTESTEKIQNPKSKIQNSHKIALTQKNAPRNDVIALVCGFVAGAAVIAGLTFRDPGSPKAGRVMINEHGSNWEWTTDTLNTTSYNEKTTYNYYCLAQFLRYYYDLRINQETITPQTLANIDVLILKIPTQPYEPSEIQAIVDYVRRGGSLWVIGDHTNVFGSSSFFNPLLRHFGYGLKYVSTHDLETGNLTVYSKPARFAHPSVINLPTYLFATSCSMTAPFSADAAILGYGLRADHLDYSQKNFFADRTRNQFDIEFGLMLQQAAGTYGKGRVLVTTDSTPFSNFFIFVKGKPELALGTLNWLNRNPKWAWLNPLLLIIGLAMLAGIFIRKLWGGAALAGAILGLALAGGLTDQAARGAYHLPQPAHPVPWINFEREHSQYFLPVLRLVKDGDPDYLTFYVWTQRVGAVPRQVDNFRQAVSGNDPVVMIDPATELNPQELADLRSYLDRGGHLLVMNSVENRSEAAGRLLENFGIGLKLQKAPSDTLHTLTLQGRFFPLAVKGKFTSLEGGEPFFKSDQGDVIGVTKAVGRGKIWALSCGHLFRNNQMGQTSIVPDEGLKALYEVEFGIIRDMLGK